MMQTTAIVVGAGHAGLAMSRRLTEHSIDHIVLERGEVANSWRTQRWPTLRLLTPNWQTRLPGHDYAGDDPDGFMPAADVVATLTRYARLVGAPVRTGVTIHTVRAAPEGFQLRSVTATIEGQMNVLGILGADPDVRNGFDAITVRFAIDADASRDDLQALIAQSQKRSAVFDVVANPTKVLVELA